MHFTKTTEEEIHSQINAGFTKSEIKTNLILKGMKEAEIMEAFSKVDFEKAAATSSSGQSVSVKSILFGILFVVIAFISLARFVDTGSLFLGLEAIISIAIAVYYFTRRG